MMGKKFIPLSVPNLQGRELEYVTHAIETEWVSTGGAYINEFEKKVAHYAKARGAVACQSGTAGLHIALLCCGVTENAEVIVPALTFIAAVNPVKYVGAEPVFMDCDDSLTMDAEKLKDFCENQCSFLEGKLINNESRKQIKAIMVVHVFGNLADMEKIMDIADKYNLKVIEDATEAIGSYYLSGKNARKSAGTIGHVGVFSFNGNKIMTTGGGGMIISNDDEILKRSKHLTTQAKTDEVYFEHDEVGYNYRMTNLQAALGLAQLERLEEFLTIKKNNFEFYQKSIENIPGLAMLAFKKKTRPNYWFYSLSCNEHYPLDRDGIIQLLASHSIQARPIWALICDQKPYRNNQAYRIEKSRMYVEHIVNLPCSTNLAEEEILRVVECLRNP
jgi:aminotransferase in exopolysaccharide biosynthesis